MKLSIRYADKTRKNFREIKTDCPQIKSRKLTFKEMDFCDEVARLHKKSNEEIMGWMIVE